MPSNWKMKWAGGISNGPIFNLLALNNIFDVGNNAFRDNLKDGSFLDHNGYTQERDELNPNLREGWEKNGLFGHVFEYQSSEGWTHYLAPGNAGIDDGFLVYRANLYLSVHPWFFHPFHPLCL